MGWFSKRKRTQITNPVVGQLQVVSCSPFPDVAGEMVLYPQCEIDGVITADRRPAFAVKFKGYGVPKPKWPRPGMVLPVTLDLADPSRFRIEWDQVPTGAEAASSLAAVLNTQQQADQQSPMPDKGAFPRFWQAVTYAGASSSPVGALTSEEIKRALSDGGESLGLFPTTAKVLAAEEVRPSSAPGGTWDITVSVTNLWDGPNWEAVTRMSFSSLERRMRRTAPGQNLPVLVDPVHHARILVDVSRLD